MSTLDLMEIFEEMILRLGERTMLDELFNALSNDELEENLRYICKNYDMDYLFSFIDILNED